MIIRHHFSSLKSTNDWGKQWIHEWDRTALTIITAEEQTAGRGRFGKQWQSPKGENLLASFVFFQKKDQADLTELVRLLARVTIKLLQEWGFEPTMKWPNDILIQGKKIAGILCEIIPLDESQGIVLGIGLNVNMGVEALSAISQPATSLFVESGRQWDIEQILQPLAELVQQEAGIN